MTTKPTDIAKHFIAALSVDEPRREIRQGNPQAAEAEIERMATPEPARIAHAKQILGPPKPAPLRANDNTPRVGFSLCSLGKTPGAGILRSDMQTHGLELYRAGPPFGATI
jgi:hypothetical protein